MPASAKLAWSEFCMSGRTVRSGMPLASAMRSRNGSSPAKPLVSAAKFGLPPTESRLTLRAMRRRSSARQALHVLRRAGERPLLDAEEGEPHAAPVNPSPEGQRTRRRQDGREPARIVHGALAAVVAVDVGAEHDPFVALPGQIEQQRAGLGRPLLGLDRQRRLGQPRAVRRSAAAASGAMPAAGMPLPSCRPDEPATSCPGSGPAIRKPTAPASRAARYLRRR